MAFAYIVCPYHFYIDLESTDSLICSQTSVQYAYAWSYALCRQPKIYMEACVLHVNHTVQNVASYVKKQ